MPWKYYSITELTTPAQWHAVMTQAEGQLLDESLEEYGKRMDVSATCAQSAKFSQLFEGPYTIVKPHLNGSYVITDGDGSRDIVHVDRLRPFAAYTHMIPELVAAARPLRSTLRRFKGAAW
ncbi:hypothetical protein BGZ73_008546 [Actinomortierella ambigua]|nr:hypothetical protein BGZ73_008546 [Actinomortierella ambigua]